MKYTLNNPSYNKLIEEIEQIFNDSSNVLFQGRNQIKIVEFNGKKVAIKSFKIPNFITDVTHLSNFVVLQMRPY